MDKEEIYRVLNKAYFSENCDEKEELQRLAPIVARAKCFVDIAASLGQYTNFANRHMTGGEIYAIEADPIRFEELERNCGKWAKESDNRLYPIHAAVSDIDGVTGFFTTNSNVSGGLFIHPVKSENVQWQEVEVRSITLDRYFGNKFPDFVKIDIEGGELRALHGAKWLLTECKPLFFIEVHSWADPEGQRDQYEVYDYMTIAGYERQSIMGKVLFRPVSKATQDNVAVHSNGITRGGSLGRRVCDSIRKLFQ
jgi:FkbM family methyltransferase